MDLIAYRKSLVPRWIKVFGWIFIVMAAAIPIMWCVYPFLKLSQPARFEIFGLYAVGSPYFYGAILIQSIIVFLGVSAYGLLFGKSWGLIACLINGYLGIAICLFTMFMSGLTSLRLEPLIQVPYLIKLHKIRGLWGGPKDAI